MYNQSDICALKSFLSSLRPREEKEGLSLGKEPPVPHSDADPSCWNGMCFRLCRVEPQSI